MNFATLGPNMGRGGPSVRVDPDKIAMFNEEAVGRSFVLALEKMESTDMEADDEKKAKELVKRKMYCLIPGGLIMLLVFIYW